MMKKRGLMLIACAFAAGPFCHGEMHFSFLDTEAALGETTRLLEAHGLPTTNVQAFAPAVRKYYEAGFQFDTSRFPESVGGHFVFDSP